MVSPLDAEEGEESSSILLQCLSLAQEERAPATRRSAKQGNELYDDRVLNADVLSAGRQPPHLGLEDTNQHDPCDAEHVRHHKGVSPKGC